MLIQPYGSDVAKIRKIVVNTMSKIDKLIKNEGNYKIKFLFMSKGDRGDLQRVDEGKDRNSIPYKDGVSEKMRKIIFLLLMLVLIVSCSSNDEKLKVCPDAWYDNRIPAINPSEETQYLIVNGERAEISNYDLDWIRENCEVNEPMAVY